MTRLLALSALVAAVGCAAAVEMSFDEDVDGLLSIDEVEVYGTDPLNPDSDGDGHFDGAEVLAGTDPLDPDDHPYHADWPIDGACRNNVEGPFGSDVDQHAQQFRLLNQHGDRVRLHDFCGQVVMLKRSAGWCGACRASEGQNVALYNEYKDRGFMSVTLILETDARGEQADQEFLQGWADQYGATHPIVADEGYGNQFERDGGIPTYVLLAPGAKLVKVDQGFPTAAEIEALLPR
jgi:hypothetical protein